MSWSVVFHPEMAKDFDALPHAVKKGILTVAKALEVGGPTLGRPLVGTLTSSKIRNLKELRFEAAEGEWRVAFAFDRTRIAVLLAAGDKRPFDGRAEQRFYNRLIRSAEERWATWP
ncbi:type II toxin-antitoxin system RelE/ParE family toxin [Roseicella aquatilis]|uniref:Addiction module toxin RelE n=1 Tax=Roseicella aquatilis TaxID=2527868 RepID=A0A4R4DT43_9PROT|nr:type II toxin-antitoxin system RelE/ParE family toxin [Roseicella aquatilis]TCZ63224.1 addiction module toxin RelE [Roseicella aquatilis]